MMEIERKFLVDFQALSGLGARFDTCSVVEQAYLTVTEKGSIRIRHHQDKGYTITVKTDADSKSGALSRVETELPLAQELYAAMLPLAPCSLKKIRYELGPWEFDVFQGELLGLCVLEIELLTPTSAVPEFPKELEPFVLLEVTDYPSFRNENLAQHGLPKFMVGGFKLPA
jgi:CYTH domain-containing protein